jgi:hypothetical protein
MKSRKISKTRTKHRRSHRKHMRGGNRHSPFIGAPYNAGAAVPSGNYYAYNTNVKAVPDQSNTLLGGGKNPISILSQSIRSIKRKRNGGHKRSGKSKRSSKYKRNKRSSKKGSSRSRRMRGGGLGTFVAALVPQEALNIGRSVPAAFGHAYDKFTGVLSTPSSLVYPTQQPLAIGTDVGSARMMPPPDIMGMYKNANNTVAAL